ncbi:MAG: hypothetical protein B6U78_00360 [Candidatus Aenigmarchaeota archaeon ex4484_224]|nr:MAG: hypothetical protein B6U78_00360 [Candidatus Aenigmarchaeota archaeon ex4484_224]
MEKIIYLILAISVVLVLLFVAFRYGLNPLYGFSKEGICRAEIMKICSENGYPGLREKLEECWDHLPEDLKSACQTCKEGGDCSSCCSSLK